MTVRIDIGSLKVRETGNPDIFEVSVDVTEGTEENGWENEWRTISAQANKNEPVADILKRLRAEYVRKYKQSIAVQAVYSAIYTALKKDANAGTFTRQDPNPPKSEPMEVKIVTEV
jgi:hypothetical protein